MNVQCLFYGSHLYLVMVSNLVSDGFSTAEYLYTGKCITFEFDQMFNGKILPWIANAYSPLYEHYCVVMRLKNALFYRMWFNHLCICKLIIGS